MASLSKKTSGQMIDAVGALIDIVLTNNTTPSRAQVVQWLNVGVIETLRAVPVEELRDMMKDYTSTLASQINESEIGDRVFKIVTFTRNFIACNKVDDKVFLTLATKNPFKYTADNPAYAHLTLGGSSIFRAYPVERGYLSIVYIPMPFVYQTGPGTEESEAPDDTAIPEVLEHFVIDYAAAMARVQDEEPAQYQLYKQDWMQRIQMAHGLPIEPVDGS